MTYNFIGIFMTNGCYCKTLQWFDFLWWRHQTEIFSALLTLCARNSPITGEFPSQRPVTRSFGVFVDLRLNKRLSKQLRRRRFEAPSCSLWRQCNVPKVSFDDTIAKPLGADFTVKCTCLHRNSVTPIECISLSNSTHTHIHTDIFSS